MGWIAWVKGLCTRAEVLTISKQLGIDPKMVAACCMLLWEWADDETEEGGTFVPLDAVQSHADTVTGVPGFGEALTSVGWLVSQGTGCVFPNWSRHNGITAKARMKEAARKAKWRDKRDKCPASDGTKTGPTVPHSTVQNKEKTLAEPPRAKKVRTEVQVERDALWDAIVAEWKLPTATRTQQGRVGKLVAEFKGCGATPEEIRRRRKWLASKWDSGMDTPEAVAKQWSQAEPPAPELPFNQQPEWQAMKKYEVPT